MNNKNIVLALLTVVSLLFVSCDYYADQEVASPTVFEQKTIQDTGFIAAPTTAAVTLTEAKAADSTEILTVSTLMSLVNPNAGIQYVLQLSSNKNFTDTAEIGFRFNGKAGSKVKVLNSDLNTALDKLTGSLVEVSLYARMIAVITNGGTLIKQISVADANKTVATFKVTPYSLLKDYKAYTPKTWYIVGLGGNWNNSVDGLGSSLIPLSFVTGKEYNSSGDGKFVYTGYFSSATSFKLIHTPGDWNTQWGNKSSEGINSPVVNDGGSSNFKVPADGYYTITLNSIKNTLTISAATVTPVSYTLIGLIGGFNGWGGDVALTANSSTGNHTWYTTYTFSSDTEGKFRANGGWDINWGNADKTFPIGFGAQGKDNIPFKAGTYTVLFNDIDGCYWFVAK
jgi:hypothetical protein